MDMLVVIRGGGDIATGIALRLHRSHMAVVICELPAPTAIRRTVSFSEAMRLGETAVEGVTARRADLEEIPALLERGEIPVLADPAGSCIRALAPDAVVDAVLAKRNLGTTMDMAPAVVAAGPGFTAGTDCHGVVETMRGHHLGRLLLTGSAQPNTGVPGDVGGYTTERLIRAPADGPFEPLVSIGDRVEKGQAVARVTGLEVAAAIPGIVRGLLPRGLPVTRGMKAGDIDPRCRREHCFTVSDKARAIGGGVLEGLLHFSR